MRGKSGVIVARGLIVIAVLAVFLCVPWARRTTPGRIIRWCLGEPGATQDVNDAADVILSEGWEPDLMALSDSLLAEYRAMPTRAPGASFMGGFLIPIEKLPDRYRQLGGTYSGVEPEFAFRPRDDSGPDRIVIGWAHMRHAVIIYSVAPPGSPTGFHVRKVSARMYVVANEG